MLPIGADALGDCCWTEVRGRLQVVQALVLYPPSFLERGVECGLKVRVTVGQFKAVIEEGDRLLQLPPMIGISSLTARFVLSDDLKQ